jgi:hypothetical protein
VKPALAFAPRETRILALIANPVLGMFQVFVARALGGLTAIVISSWRSRSP